MKTKKQNEVLKNPRGICLIPVVTEKAVNAINVQNALTFTLDRNFSKDLIKKEVENLFDVKVEKVRTSIRNNKKYAYIQLKTNFLAIDIATKLGLM